VVGALFAFSVLAPAAPAQAHAFLESSNPADGSVVATAPSTLRLGFSESVVLASMRIDIVDGHGRHVAPTALRLQSAREPGATEDPVAIVAELPDLDRGVYRVEWETLSSDDLHRTAGVLVFGVGTGQSVQAAGLKEAQPRIDEASLRWLVLLSLALCLGGALALRLLSRDTSPGAVSATRAATRWSLAGAAAGTVLTVILLADQLAPGAAGARQLLFGWYGERWLLREVGFVLLLGSTLLLLRERMPRLRAWFFLSGAVMASGGTALLGHAGAETRLSVTRVAADATHLAAATTWAGTLVVLTLVVGPRLLTGALGAGAVRGVLRSFGVPAAACVSVMVVTGVYLTSEVIGSVDAALLTTYGRVLLLKIVVAVLGGALALVTHLRLRRRNPKALPRRAVAIEAGAAVVALGLVALLTSGQPALEPQFVSSPVAVPSQVVDGPVADLQESVSISPNRPGANVVMVSVYDTRRPSPGPVREVVVSLVGDSGHPGRPLSAEPLSDGRWSLSTQVAGSGPVSVHVLVRRAGLPDAVRGFGWTVGGGQLLTRPAVVSTAPISEVLRLTCVLLVLLLVAMWVLVPLIFRKGGIRWGREALPSLVYADRSTVVTAPASGSRPGSGQLKAEDPDMAYRGRFSFRWRRVLTPVPSVAAVLVLLGGSVLTTAPALSLGPVPAAAATTAATALEPDQPPASVTKLPAQAKPEQVVPAVPAVTAVTTSGSGSVSQALLPSSAWSVPDQLLAAYRKAVAGAPLACHLPVSLLAAIGQVESGSLAGRSLDTAHRVVPPVLGPLLDGVSFAAIPDTDGGRLDGNPRWDRAVGPMQFIPSTWAGSGVDGDGDGQADPQNVYDATASAAGYLCAHGRDLALDSGLRSAILSYNHSDVYLADVLDWARRFGAASGGSFTVPANFSPAPANLISRASAGSMTARPHPSKHTATTSAGSSSPQPTPGNPATGPTNAPPSQTDPPPETPTSPTSSPGPPDPTKPDPVVAADGPGIPQPVPVAEIALSPQAGRDFGDQRLGVTSHELALTIQNPGTAPLTFTGPPVFSSSDFALAGHGDCTDPIAPEGSCTLHVTFKPSGLGARKGALTIHDSAPGGPHSYNNVTGVGVQPAVALAPTALSFGQVPVGDTDEHVVTLRNTGTDVLTVTDLSSSNAAVSVTSTDALPFTVAPGAVASLTVTFAAKSVGAVTATISVTDDAPGSPQSISVTGSGQARADLAVVIASLTSTKPKSSLTYTITLNNNGPTDAKAVRVVDTLPEEVTFSSVSAPDGVTCTTPDVDTTGTVVCTLATMQPSATSITIKIVTTVTAHATGSFINTAVVSSSTADPDTANNTATVTNSAFGKE